MTEMKLPAGMVELRPHLSGIVGSGAQYAPSFSILLSSRHGLTIFVDNREERVTESPPAAGTVLSAFDGATTFERALVGFNLKEVETAARELVSGVSFQKYTSPTQAEGEAILLRR